MADYAVRSATLEDLSALTDIYNHYVVHTAITFDLQTFTAATRREWFDDHAETGPYRLLVATDAEGGCLGYASSSRWRPNPAYNTTVEASVYCFFGHNAVEMPAPPTYSVKSWVTKQAPE